MSVATRRFGADVAITVGGKVAFAVSGGLLTILVARALGPAGQGVFAAAFSLSLLLLQIGSLGLPASQMYFAAREPEARDRLAVASVALGVAAGLALVAGGAVVKVVWPSALQGLSWTALAITLVAMPFSLSTLFLQGVLLGEGRAVAYGLLDAIPAVTALAGVVAGLALGGLGVTEVLAIITASRVLGTAIALGLVRGRLRPSLGVDRGLLDRVLRHGLRIYVVTIVIFMIIRLDVLLVNALLGSTPAGVYSLAATIAEALLLLPSAISLNLLPRVATAEGTEGTALTFRVVAVVYGALVALSVPLVLVGAPLALGDGFEDTGRLYAWLAPGVFFLGLLTVLTAHFNVPRYPTRLIAAWAAGLVLNIVLNVALLPSLGVTVAPIASTLAYLLVLVVHLVALAPQVGGAGRLVPRVADGRELLGLLPSRPHRA